MRLELSLKHAWPGGFALDVQLRTEARRLAIRGPSGAGKSTVLSCLAGLVKPDHGLIEVDGRRWLDTTGGVNLSVQERRIGLVLQEAWLFPLLSVRRNLAYGAGRAQRDMSVEELARRLEIGHLLDRQPRHLSGGERRRVALGRALLSDPGLLLCDEPLHGLDVATRDRMLPVFDAITELGIPLVVVSHDPAVIEALADEVVDLVSGRVG